MLRKIKLNMMWNRIGFASILIFLVLALLIAMKYLGGQSTLQAVPVTIEPEVCEFEGKPYTKPVFKVYDSTNSKYLASRLCKEIKKELVGLHEYSAVEVTYYLGESDKNMQLQKGVFDLFKVKQEYEQSLPRIGTNRIALASYSGYDVYLISKNGMPKLDGSYLSGKSLGLLTNRRSESGYKYPMKIIEDSVSEEQRPTFKSNYAKHGDLRRGLQNGEVDLIASYWNDDDRRKYPGWQSLKIANVPKGDIWYLDLDNKNPDIACNITTALMNNAKNQSEAYWENISIHYACTESHE